jgi:hypothetical protein
MCKEKNPVLGGGWGALYSISWGRSSAWTVTFGIDTLHSLRPCNPYSGVNCYEGPNHTLKTPGLCVFTLEMSTIRDVNYRQWGDPWMKREHSWRTLRKHRSRTTASRQFFSLGFSNARPSMWKVLTDLTDFFPVGDSQFLLFNAALDT